MPAHVGNSSISRRSSVQEQPPRMRFPPFHNRQTTADALAAIPIRAAALSIRPLENERIDAVNHCVSVSAAGTSAGAEIVGFDIVLTRLGSENRPNFSHGASYIGTKRVVIMDLNLTAAKSISHFAVLPMCPRDPNSGTILSFVSSAHGRVGKQEHKEGDMAKAEPDHLTERFGGLGNEDQLRFRATVQ